MKRVRIVKRIEPNGEICYVIQKRILWQWFDAGAGTYAMYVFDTYDEAVKNLWRWSGKEVHDEVVYDSIEQPYGRREL